MITWLAARSNFNYTFRFTSIYYITHYLSQFSLLVWNECYIMAMDHRTYSTIVLFTVGCCFVNAMLESNTVSRLLLHVIARLSNCALPRSYNNNCQQPPPPHLNNTRIPTERVNALCVSVSPTRWRLILTRIKRRGCCFCDDYIYR